MMQPEKWMEEALELAGQAYSDGEVPVGAVIVKDGKIVGTGRNRTEKGKSALAHAEIEAIAQACAALGTWRLTGCTLYVTLEPCPMCAGALINARISRIYYGARDENAGACGSVLNLFEEEFHHRPRIYAGLCETACADILSRFFQTLRQNR